MTQGTIKDYDTTTKCGTILGDDADEFPFDHAAFSASGVRLFRIGQRVRFDVHGEGSRRTIRNLTIVTL